VSFAREGLVFIVLGILLAAAALFAAIAWRSWPLWLLAFVLIIIALWIAYFFRDPERNGQRGGGLVIAPADGRVVMITEVDEPAFLHGKALRVSIFMNVFNVHVNRYPVSRNHALRALQTRQFLNAAIDKSSLENSKMSVGIEMVPCASSSGRLPGSWRRRS
jgi:phosphatidylserine decarboxylase